MFKKISKKIKTLFKLDYGWALRYYPKKLVKNLAYGWASLRKNQEIVEIDGLKLLLSFYHPIQYSFVKKVKTGRHEADLLVRWKRNSEINKGDVLDLGGYSGLFGLISAKLNPESRVYIFEPDTVNARHVENNIALNRLNNAALVKGAVADKTGQLRFKEHRGGEAGNLTGGDGDRLIDVYALDDFIKEKGIKPTLIKLDVEGAEYAALTGLKEYLKQAEAVDILLELHYDLIKKYGRSPRDVMALLDELNYKCVYLDKNRYNEHYWVYKKG